MRPYFLTAATAILFFLCQDRVFSQAKKSQPAYQTCRLVLRDVNFSVDPRIELFHTIEVVQGIRQVNFVELDYKEKILQYFGPFKQHPLFRYLDRRPMYGDLFKSIDAPIRFLLCLDDQLNWQTDILQGVTREPALDTLRLLMQDFAAKTNYVRFFNSNADLYQISLQTLTYNFPGFDEKKRLMDYAGNKDYAGYQFNVILNFLGWGNFGPRLQKQHGAELYAVIAPEKSAIRVPTFDIRGLYRLLWHEFGHSFANPAAESVGKELDQLDRLWAPVKEPMHAQAYDSWRAVITEHLTEALACRMAALKFGEDAADLNFVRVQRGMRWLYLDPLISALKYYEANRKTYPTLNSFMPRIVERLQAIRPTDIEGWQAASDALRKPDTSAMPSIGSVYDRKHILIILSSDEPDQVSDGKLKKYIAETKARIGVLKEATIVADTTALKMDLSGYNLFVWGTPWGNKFLQKYLPEIPLLIKKDKVIAEGIYEGPGHAVLIGWVNPFNLRNVMTIYAGQNPMDVVDINTVMHGSGNYHIIRNFITIKYGDFKRQGMVWQAK